MVFERTCTFCGGDIHPGTGKMYVKKDGTVFYFCKSKCQKNLLKLRRIGREIKWTETYRKIYGEEKEAEVEEKEEELEESELEEEEKEEEEAKPKKKPKRIKKVKKLKKVKE